MPEAMNAAFRYETEMLQPAQDWLAGQGLLTRFEFATPWGVCDLVGVSLNSEKVALRLAKHQRRPLGPPSRIALLRQLPDEEAGTFKTLDRLEKELEGWLTPEQLRDELDLLVAWKYATKPQSNGFQRINGWAPLQNRIVALELKLARVSDAVVQALSHTRLTPESYVGLPIAAAMRVADSPRRRAFKSAGIGLVAVSRNGCEVLIEASSSRAEVDPILEMHCVERFWRAHLRGNST